jgi:hypothetical protein
MYSVRPATASSRDTPVLRCAEESVVKVQKAFILVGVVTLVMATRALTVRSTIIQEYVVPTPRSEPSRNMCGD